MEEIKGRIKLTNDDRVFIVSFFNKLNQECEDDNVNKEKVARDILAKNWKALEIERNDKSKLKSSLKKAKKHGANEIVFSIMKVYDYPDGKVFVYDIEEIVKVEEAERLFKR